MTTISFGADQVGAQDVAPAMELAALNYAARGWHVFPCAPGTKIPLFPKSAGGRGQHDATTDPEQIRRWWRQHPTANIGIHLAPSNLVVVDLDTYKGEATINDLPETLTQISARGGKHAVFRAEPDTKYARPKGVENLDVKHKGYILVAPSTFEGGTYKWHNDTPPAPAPEWLKRPPVERIKQLTDSAGRTLAEAEEALRWISPDLPYDEYLKVLMALHEGFGNEALTIAEEWADRYEDPTHHHRAAEIEYKFSSFDDATDGGVTASHLFHMAREGGCDIVALGEKHRREAVLSMFSAVDPGSVEVAKSLFEIAAEAEAAEEATDVYPLLTPSALAARRPPEFLIGRHIPQGGLGFLVAHPGVGKSFMALDMGLTIAAGLGEWHGETVRPTGDGSVLYVASEGSFDLPLRIEAWRQSVGFRGSLERFFVLEASVNFMDAASVEKLLRSVTTVQAEPSLVVVDTVSRALPGADENLQKDMTLFVAACEKIKARFGCAVMGLHHSAKNGGIRGSSVLEGAGDFVMIMEREKEERHGTLFMHKQKAAPDGWSYPFTLRKQVVDLAAPLPEGVHEWASLSFAKSILGHVGGTGGGPEAGIESGIDGRQVKEAAGDALPHAYPFDTALAAMARAWLDGEPWSKEPRSKRYAVDIMREHYGIPKAVAKAALASWIEAGTVVSKHHSRAVKRAGLYVNMTSQSDVFG